MLGLRQKKTRLKTQYYYYYYHYSLIRLISSEAKNTLNSPQTILYHLSKKAPLTSHTTGYCCSMAVMEAIYTEKQNWRIKMGSFRGSASVAEEMRVEVPL